MDQEPISAQRMRHENALLWKFVAKIADQDDTHNGMVAHAILKRFKKDRHKVLKSRMRLPNIKL